MATINLYIPLVGIDRERMVGKVPNGQRKRAAFTKSVDVRTYVDPLASRNLANAIPLTDRTHPVNRKHAPLGNAAPRGWRMQSGPCPECMTHVAMLLRTSGPSDAPSVDVATDAPARVAAVLAAAPEPEPRKRGRRQCPVHGRAGLATCDLCGDPWHVAGVTVSTVGPDDDMSGAVADTLAGIEAMYAAEPEPEPETLAPSRRRRTIARTLAACPRGCGARRDARHMKYHLRVCAGPAVTAEPVAPPALISTAPSADRPTCPRCGQTFRKSGNGLAWHVANRPDCAAGRMAVAA